MENLIWQERKDEAEEASDEHLKSVLCIARRLERESELRRSESVACRDICLVESLEGKEKSREEERKDSF